MAETLREYLVALGFKVDEASFRKFNTAVLKSAEPVLKLGAAATGAAFAIEVMVERVARQMEDLYYASQRTNATANSLRAVGFAAKQVGLEAGQGTNLLEGLGRAMRMNPGVEGLIRSFGVSTRTANGGLRDMSGVLDDLLGKLAAMPRFQALRFGEALGLNSEALNQILNNLPQFIASQEEARQSLRHFGVDAKQVSKDSAEFERHLNALEQNFENLATRVAHDWMPTAQGAIDQLNRFVLEFGDLNNEFDGMPGKIASIVSALGGLLGIMALFPSGRAAISAAVRSMAPGLLRFMGPVGAFLATMQPTETGTGEQAHIDAHPEIYGKPAKKFKPGSFESVVNYFEVAGWSHEQAVGIATNLVAESGLNPKASGDNGQAFGVAQWHPDRQKRFAEMFGHSIKTANLNEQLQFVQRELTTSEGHAGSLLKGATTAKQAAEIFSREYERPAGGDTEAARRGQLAVTIQQKTEIHVSGAGDANGTAKAIADEQGRVNGDLVRNLGTVVR